MSRRNGGQGAPKRRNKKPKSLSYKLPFRMFLSESDKAVFEEVLTKVELLTEITLPLGKCTAADVQLMRDCFNLASLFRDKAIGHAVNEEFVTENAQVWDRLAVHFPQFYKKTLGGCYVCTADEMNTLRDGFIFVGKLIRIEFANEPGWVLKCYHALKYSILANEHSPVGDSVNAGPNELENAAVRAITNGNSLAKRCVA